VEANGACGTLQGNHELLIASVCGWNRIVITMMTAGHEFEIGAGNVISRQSYRNRAGSV